MSKDMLGSVVRAAVGVPQDRLELLARIASDLGSEDPQEGDAWHSHYATARKQGLPEKAQSKLPSVVATTGLAAVAEKKTKKCFPKPRYCYRDCDVDNWLPADQPSTDACVITTLALKLDWTFAEATAKVLGIGAGSSSKLLGQALIENGHTMTLAQAEEMVEATERGDKTGMRTDGYGNFFFVETGNEDDPVSFGSVFRDVRDWSAFVYRLGSDDRWGADYRLLVRNLDASKL